MYLQELQLVFTMNCLNSFVIYYFFNCKRHKIFSCCIIHIIHIFKTMCRIIMRVPKWQLYKNNLLQFLQFSHLSNKTSFVMVILYDITWYDKTLGLSSQSKLTITQEFSAAGSLVCSIDINLLTMHKPFISTFINSLWTFFVYFLQRSNLVK